MRIGKRKLFIFLMAIYFTGFIALSFQYALEPKTNTPSCFLDWKNRMEGLWKDEIKFEDRQLISSNLIWMKHENLLLHAQKTISLISLELIGSSHINSKNIADVSIEQRCKEAIKWRNYLKQIDVEYSYMPLAMIEIYDGNNLIAFDSFYGSSRKSVGKLSIIISP